MDKTKRMQRVANRLLDRLAIAGPSGLRRSKLIADVSNHDYRFGAEVLNACLCDGRIETVDGFVRLTLAGVDEIAARGRSREVDAWLNLDTCIGAQFRQLRHEMTGGHDVALHPASRGERPVYRCAQGELSDQACRMLPDFMPDDADFWLAPEPIPAGKPGLVLVPDPVTGDLAEIEIPARDFAWTPQVFSTGPHPGGSVAVMTLPDVSVDAPKPEDFWA